MAPNKDQTVNKKSGDIPDGGKARSGATRASGTQDTLRPNTTENRVTKNHGDSKDKGQTTPVASMQTSGIMADHDRNGHPSRSAATNSNLGVLAYIDQMMNGARPQADALTFTVPLYGGTKATRLRAARNHRAFMAQRNREEELITDRHGQESKDTEMGDESPTARDDPKPSALAVGEHMPGDGQKSCVNCGATTHDVVSCLWANKDDGTIHGCPIHNSVDHTIDECHAFLRYDLGRMIEVLINGRGNRPPFQTLIPEFWYILTLAAGLRGVSVGNHLPWTTEFAKSFVANPTNYQDLAEGSETGNWVKPTTNSPVDPDTATLTAALAANLTGKLGRPIGNDSSEILPSLWKHLMNCPTTPAESRVQQALDHIAKTQGLP